MDQRKCNNYHPITLVPSCPKTLEKVIVHLIIYFLSNWTYIRKSQFELKKESTKKATATVINNIIESQNYKTECNYVLLDLSKSVDYIEHNILMDKLC